MAAEVGPGYLANVAVSPGRERDRTPAEAEAAGHLRPDEPPDEVDLRAPWYRIGDQDKTGSCVGWALADSVLWRQLVRQGRIEEGDRLSPRFVWMAAKELRTKKTDADGAPDWRPTTFLERGLVDVKSGLDVLRRYGAAFERDLPFHGPLHRGDVAEFYDVAARNKVTAYYRLDPDGEPPEAWFGHWRRWLDQHGPVLVTVSVDRAFGDGEPLLESYDAATAAELHAAALVGYGGAGFLIRCSWGEEWGSGGYVAATEAWLAAAVAESYGIVV